MLTDEQVDRIQRQIQSKGKIAGIKLYREFTGASLLESKQKIEQILDGRQSQQTSNPSHDNPDLDDELMDSILNAIEDGNKVRAVKLYKDATGKSLRTSKEFIEELMLELEMADPEAVGKTGCLLLVMAVLIGVALLF